MAIGPRLEFRQSQMLVMTPQLRQAIKLLQFNNLEAAAFVEEELERNPLLERDERSDAPIEQPAVDQPAPALAESADTADLVGAASIPEEGSGPLDTEFDGYEAYGAADGIRMPAGAGSTSFDTDDRDLADLVETRRSLRDHLSEQLRLTFDDGPDRLIGAYLIALLDPAGRLSAEPVAVAQALGAALAQVEAVRARMMAFDPVGCFARTLAECLAAQLRDKNRFDPAMAALVDNLELLAKREHKRLLLLCGVDWDDGDSRCADAGRAGWRLDSGIEPGNAAAGARK